MKKLFTSLILLVAGVVAMQAANYDLYVCGTQVTDANKSNIKPGVSFDGSKTLTLNNATLNGGSDYAIQNAGIDGLTIKIVGTCTVKANTDVFYLQKNTTVDGVFGVCATLNVESTANDGAAFWVRYESELNIYNLWLTATGIGYCFYGDGKEKLYFSCCVMTAKETNPDFVPTGAIHGFTTATFDAGDAYLTTGAFNSSAKAVCVNSSSTTELAEVKTDASLHVGSAIARIGTVTMNLTPEGMTSGSIKWSNSDKTLTLNGVELTTTKWNAILNNKVENLKIKIVGTNSLKGSNGANIYSKKGLTIEGDGPSLGTNAYLGIGDSWTGILVEGNDLTINNAVIVVAVDGAGIAGSDDIDHNLIVKKSLILARGKSNGAVFYFKDCTLDGCCSTAFPTTNYCWRSNLNAFGTATAKAVGEDQIVAIGVPNEWYDVFVMGTQLNDLNSSIFATDGLTEGTITYDKATKTLTLNGVTLTNPVGKNNSFGIETIGETNFVLEGTNNVTSYITGLALEGNTTIKGQDLNVTSTNSSGIGTWGSGKLTIECGTLYAKGKDSGYFTNSNAGQLVLNKHASYWSDYTFEGETAAIHKIGDLKLTNMDFYTDVYYGEAGCYFDADANAVLVNGGAVAKKVNIYKVDKRYGIKIGDTEITNCNRFGVGSRFITAGGGEAVTFDNSGVLTLNGATINTEGGIDINCIRNADPGVENLTINVASDSRLEPRVNSWGGFYTTQNTTITGAGKLTVDYSNSPSYCFSVSGGSLTLKDINMSLAGDLKGYASGGDNYLYIDLAAGKRVEVAGSVYDFTDITFRNGSKLLEPEGAWYDNSNKWVTTGSGKATGIVFADKDATGIEGVLMNDADLKVEGIFDAQGRQLEEMQPGVNILRMSDGSTRKVVKK